MSERVLITAEELCFAYQEQCVVDKISFRICEKDFLAIVGPNGAGKSTLIKLLIGFLRPQSGTVTRSIPRERIGYVPQYIVRTHNFPATVREILAACAPPASSPRIRRRGTADAAHLPLPDSLSVALAIDEIISQQFIACSAGQQQRVLIALALLRNPQLLILDEPTSGVDSKTKERFYDLLTELNTHRNIAIVLITHEVTILPPIIRQVLCINNRVHCYGPLNELPAMLQQVYGDHVVHHHHHGKEGRGGGR